MNTQPTTYKQYCENKKLMLTRQRHNHHPIAHHLQDPDNLDDDTTQQLTKRDHKNRIIIAPHNKRAWVSNIVSTIISNHIQKGETCQWKITSANIKKIVRSRKSKHTTTDIHSTDRDSSNNTQ